MVVSAVINPNIQLSTQNSMSAPQGDHSMSLESIVEPTSTHDVASFNSIVQQNMVQNTTSVSDVSPSFGSNSIAQVAMDMVDNIQSNRSKVAYYTTNFNHLSAQDMVKLQETAENFSLTSQILSKVVSTATKSIDALIHMQ